MLVIKQLTEAIDFHNRKRYYGNQWLYRLLSGYQHSFKFILEQHESK